MINVCVGMMYSYENEFEYAKRSVEAQTGVSLDIFVIEGLSNREAHSALYGEFAKRSGSADFFVKVDADMVLERSSVFLRFHRAFLKYPRIKRVTAPVWDWLPYHYINGMHAFRGKIDWEVVNDIAFTDRVTISDGESLFLTSIGRAITHCKDSSPFHAFHYGYHRGMKCVAALSRGRSFASTYVTMLHEIDRCWRQYFSRGDRRRLLAAAGGEMALANQVSPEDVDYGSARLAGHFEEIDGLGEGPLIERVRELRKQNRSSLPNPWKIELHAQGVTKVIARRFLPLHTRERMRNLAKHIKTSTA